jgi:hypothetical protein
MIKSEIWVNVMQHWDETGHKWPRHKLNSDCNAK